MRFPLLRLPVLLTAVSWMLPLGALAETPNPAEAFQPRCFAVVGTNDFHGQLEPERIKVSGQQVRRGGLLGFSGYLDIIKKEHAIFKQTDADVTSFDGGYGSAYLAKMVGQKRAREIFFLGRNYSAQEAFEMGMVNAVIPHEELEDTAYDWAQEILQKSPTSIKMLKFAFNATDDGMVGQQVFAGEATRLAYMTDEAKEGRNAFLEKRKPNFKDVKWIP